MKTVSKGIVLKSIDYGDTSAVVRVYTHNHGLCAFLLRGVKGKRRKTPYLQPLSLVELEFNHHPRRELIAGASVRPLEAYQQLADDVRKSMMVLFLAEVLSESLRTDAPDEDLFDYITSRLLTFDLEPFNPNFHLCFLAKLTRYLGFFPSLTESPQSFDPEEGVFSEIKHTGRFGSSGPEILTLQRFFEESPSYTSSIQLNRKLRNQLLEELLRYYQLHIEGMRPVQSLAVLREVMDD